MWWSQRDEEIRKKRVKNKVAGVSTSLAQGSGHRLVPLPIPTLVTEEVANLSTQVSTVVTTIVAKAKEASHNLKDS